MNSEKKIEGQCCRSCICETSSFDIDRRNWLLATSIAGGVGVAALAIPLVTTFSPSEKAKAAGAPVELDISGTRQ